VTDPRDKRAEAIQQLIDKALADASLRSKISELLFPPGSSPPPAAGWPAPTDQARQIARTIIVAAAASAFRGARRLGISTLASRSVRHPHPAIRPDPAPVFVGHPCPLAVVMLDDEAVYELDVLLAYAHSPRAASSSDERDLLRSPDIHLSLMRRLNGFVELEGHLWWLAGQDGFADPVPYLVRYEAARWLWTAKAAGTAFCLRCGIEIRYKRATRAGQHRQPRCRHCSRGQPVAWPAQAICPAGRGEWWLACVNCEQPFPAKATARTCSPTCRQRHHRQGTITRGNL
jgi:hypothetical protein